MFPVLFILACPYWLEFSQWSSQLCLGQGRPGNEGKLSSAWELRRLIQNAEVTYSKELFLSSVLIWKGRADHLNLFLCISNFQLEKDELEISLIATVGD